MPTLRRALHATALCCGALALDVAGRVTLVSGKARLFKAGNPLVFGGAVKRTDPKDLQPGDVVDVVDGSDALIGWGVYNPHSMYRVRLLASDEPRLLEHRDMARLMEHRIKGAAAVRSAAGLPSEQTTAYRLINGEGDRLSGLMVDVFDGTAVVVSSALWLERYRAEVCAALHALPEVSRVEWRRSEARLKKDGWEPDEEGAGAEGAGSGAAADAEAAAAAPVRVRENGLEYHVDVYGQKSGFYCDQRENRKTLAEVPPPSAPPLPPPPPPSPEPSAPVASCTLTDIPTAAHSYARAGGCSTSSATGATSLASALRSAPLP